MWWTRTLGCGDEGPDVEVVQRKLGMVVTGFFDLSTAISVRGLQDYASLPTTGFVDEDTARALGPRAIDHLAPKWFEGEDIRPGDQLWDAVMGNRDEKWLRRFQGQHRIEPTGVINERTAQLLHALMPDLEVGTWESS